MPLASSLAMVISGLSGISSVALGTSEGGLSKAVSEVEVRCFLPMVSGGAVSKEGLLITRETSNSFIGNDIENLLVFVVSDAKTHRSCMVHVPLKSELNEQLHEYVAFFEQYGSAETGALAYECFEKIFSQIPTPKMVNATFDQTKGEVFVATLNVGSFITVTAWTVPSASSCFEEVKE